jgi:putative Ca2+/H+ antiporter (TMEM165/GDT1 family)
MSFNSNYTEYLKQNDIDLPFVPSAIHSFLLIFITEIADKTFLLILFFSMRSSKISVFISAIIGLTLMNVLSVLIGYGLDLLLYKTFIDWVAFVVFMIYGALLIFDAVEMSNKTLEDRYIQYLVKSIKISRRNSEPSIPLMSLPKVSELEEGVLEISKQSKKRTNSFTEGRHEVMEKLKETEEEDYDNPITHPNVHVPEERDKQTQIGVIWTMISTISVAECGDRTQVASITLSAVYDVLGTLVGGTIALIIVSACAVFVGEKISKYLKERQINYISGAIFILFGIEMCLIKMKYIL